MSQGNKDNYSQCRNIDLGSSFLLTKYCKSSFILRLSSSSLQVLNSIKWFKRLCPVVDRRYDLTNLIILKACSLVAFFAGSTRISFTSLMVSLIILVWISKKSHKCSIIDPKPFLISFMQSSPNISKWTCALCVKVGVVKCCCDFLFLRKIFFISRFEQ